MLEPGWMGVIFPALAKVARCHPKNRRGQHVVHQSSSCSPLAATSKHVAQIGVPSVCNLITSSGRTFRPHIA
jgi:hypothetical protein